MTVFHLLRQTDRVNLVFNLSLENINAIKTQNINFTCTEHKGKPQNGR